MVRLTRRGTGAIPASAVLISIVALLTPVTAETFFPGAFLGDWQPLLWSLALVPTFLLAYHWGWKGAAIALAGGVGGILLTQGIAFWVGRPVYAALGVLVGSYLILSLGIGWLAERFHTERDQVEGLALTDLLTQLPNRRHARIFLENEFAAAGRGRKLSVVLFDLDHFKNYNDRFGHQAGDEALQAFGDIISSTTRRMNLSARFGGEEFLSVLAGTDLEGARVFAERVRGRLRAMKLSQGSITVSVGVANFHPSMKSPDELLAAADQALYRAKRDGRNRVRVFGRELLEEALAAAEGDDRRGGPASAMDHAYPRAAEELGRTRPPVTLLPHEITGFGQGRRVLLVEDEAAVRDLLVSYLTRESFQVEPVKDVEAAIGALDTEYDLIITDLKLPGRWGLELINAAKARWPTSQLLVLSRAGDSPVMREAMAAGADAFLERPFGMATLRAETQDALDRRERALARRNRRRALSAGPRGRMDQARRRILEGTRALVEAVEIRDPFILGHHDAVTRYAREILAVLDPEGVLVSRTSLALGTGHLDIGKLAVPEAILNKPEPLLPEELEVLKIHVETGAGILRDILDDDIALEVVSWHHERWDGDGYPNGLLGEAIPLPARIASVADSLEAMTSARAYRAPLPWDKAVQAVMEDSGSRFDPRVVEAFQEALPRLESLWNAGTEEPSRKDPKT